MTRQDFLSFCDGTSIKLLDGASGTALQKKGMPPGVCPEQWALDNAGHLTELQQNYIQAGSHIIATFSFGANRLKLKNFGLHEKAREINRSLAELSKKAAEGTGAYVAGDLGPTGQFMKPMGDFTFDEIVDVYKEQVTGLLEGGVDLFMIETMIHIQEARAALIAVKELCDLPVMASMTYEPSGRTITGTSPLAALITLQSMGADAIGVNCAAGPKQMLPWFEQMAGYAKVPLFAKPNAGLPIIENGEPVYKMASKEFADTMACLAPLVKIMGGCCGTSPEYISKLASANLDRELISSYNNVFLTSEAEKAPDFDDEEEMGYEPLCVTSADAKVIEESLRCYPGRALVDVSGLNDAQLQKIQPIADRYGAILIK